MIQLRVALVTGSCKKRIGRAVASALAERGYAVVVHYHTSAQEADEAVAQFRQFGVTVQADLTDESAVQTLFQTVRLR